MDRRGFVLAALAGALATPAATHAQHVRTSRRLGILHIISQRSDLSWAFINELRDRGWVEGRNLIVEERFLKWDTATTREDAVVLGREIVDRRVDVLAAFSIRTVRILQELTSEVPITFSSINEPVAIGLVASLARPGGNLTGVTLPGVDTIGKRLELLKQVVPTLRHAGVLAYRGTHTVALDELQRTAARLRIDVHTLFIDDTYDFSSAVVAFKAQKVGGVLLLLDFITNEESTWIAAAAEHRLPTIYANPHAPERGGLIGYGENLADHIRRHARLVAKILEGRKPAELPIERPTVLKLVINLGAARRLGVTMPSSLLLRADQLIE
jgi:ABC-type uncharacterized transport system substrate-binding protein